MLFGCRASTACQIRELPGPGCYPTRGNSVRRNDGANPIPRQQGLVSSAAEIQFTCKLNRKQVYLRKFTRDGSGTENGGGS